MPFYEDGFEIIESLVGEATILVIISELNSISAGVPAAGIRNAEKKLGSVKTLVECPTLLSKASDYLPGSPQLVRTISLDLAIRVVVDQGDWSYLLLRKQRFSVATGT